MDIDLPKGWERRGGKIEYSHYVAINSNDVCVGYDWNNPDTYSIWAGDDWDNNRTLKSSCSSESEAKLELLNFMREYPMVRYKSGSGLGTLYDENDSIVLYD